MSIYFVDQQNVRRGTSLWQSVVHLRLVKRFRPTARSAPRHSSYLLAVPANFPALGFREANGIQRIGAPGGDFSLPLMSHEVSRVVEN